MTEFEFNPYDEQSPLLLSSVVPGTKCIVAGDTAAFIMCRRRQPICCLHSNMESFAIPDGSVVEILQPNLTLFGSMRRERVVGVRVLASLDSELNGALGSIRLRWLQAHNDLLAAIGACSHKSPSSFRASSIAAPTKARRLDSPGIQKPDATVARRAPRQRLSYLETFLSQIGIQPQTAAEISIGTVLARLAHGQYDFGSGLIESVTRTVFGQKSPLQIDHVRVRPPKVTLVLGRRQLITLATASGYVIDNGRLTPHPVQIRRLAFRDEVELELSPDGHIAAVRHGDVSVVKGPVSLGVKIRTERRPGRLDVDDKGRPIVDVDAQGEAVRDRDGGYRLRRYDDWLIVSVLGRPYWTGINSLRQT